MPTNHTGDPVAVQSPSAAPGPGILPVVSIPSDITDDMNTAAIAQMVKVPADYLAYYAFPNRVEQLRERWDIAAQTIAAAGAGVINDLGKRWNFYINAGTTQSCVFNNPASGYTGRTVTLNQGTGNAAQFSALSSSFPMWMPPTVPYRFLLEFDLQATSSTLNSREWHLGLNRGTAPGAASDDLVFYSDYTLANWQALCVSGSVDTGVAVSIGSTWVRFAILVDTTLVTPAALFYINGNLVATITTNLPSVGIGPYCLNFGGRQVSSGVCSFTLGDVVMTCTKF